MLCWCHHPEMITGQSGFITTLSCLTQGRCWLCRLVYTPGAAAAAHQATPHTCMPEVTGRRRYASALPKLLGVLDSAVVGGSMSDLNMTRRQLLLSRCATCLCWRPRWWRSPSAPASLHCGLPSQLARPQLIQQLQRPAQKQPQASQLVSRRVMRAARQVARALCSCHTAWCLRSPRQRASSCMTPRCAWVTCVLS